VLGIFRPEEVLPFCINPWENGRSKRKTNPENRRNYKDKYGTIWKVQMVSHRYWLFHNNPSCVACGRTGSIMVLERQWTHRGKPNTKAPHFNFYAVEKDDSWMLMTKDHITPIAAGGKNWLENYQTMCSECNELKADAPNSQGIKYE